MELCEENKLEEILRLAALEAAHRPQFYEVLMCSQVFVLGTAGIQSAGGETTLEAGSSIQIQHWEKPDGSPVIPFFSSIEVLQKSIEEEQQYLALPARSLFEITLGATLFLNPRSDFGKEFVPQEVEHILSSGVSRVAVQRVVQEETQVMLAQPSIYPSKMVDSLTQLFAKHSNVKRAFLALMHDASLDQGPHLVVGIDAEGDFERVMREAGNVAGDTAPAGEPVDLMRVDESDAGISQYFIKNTQPFYERRWGSKLKAWFGVGDALHARKKS